jgi:pantoate--beta-alanine ligase
MLVFDKIIETRSFLGQRRKSGMSIGFVPTMGALHDGHLELMQRAKKENDLLVVSIFVNPLQFNNPDDLIKYPRDFEADRQLLVNVGCDVLFYPEVEEMYPKKVTKKYDFGKLGTVMEGAFRKGHFNGVAVVVHKLFEIIEPHNAYFAEKDYQQLAIIQKMVDIEKQDVNIIACPIVREEDGLAMSSRNQRLTAEERKIAPFIFKCLTEAKQKVGIMNPAELTEMVKNQFTDQPSFNLEYFQLADDKELQPVESWNNPTGVVAFIAAYLGNVRLIDNVRYI